MRPRYARASHGHDGVVAVTTVASSRGTSRRNEMRALLSSLLLSAAMTSSAFAQVLTCDMTRYKASTGLTASVEQDLLVVTWVGQGGSEVRARYAIERNQPVVRDLAVRKQGGQWATLGQNLAP